MTAKHTPGPWNFEPLDPGHLGTRHEPPEPGYPAFVFVDHPQRGFIPICELQDPVYHVEPEEWDGVGWPDDGTRLCGDMNANARLIASAPDLLAERDALRAALEILANLARSPKYRIEMTQLQMCGFLDALLDVIVPALSAAEEAA